MENANQMTDEERVIIGAAIFGFIGYVWGGQASSLVIGALVGAILGYYWPKIRERLS
jgi:ABC-type dipeptide/oligopeptide/nickel transport system permease subunit